DSAPELDHLAGCIFHDFIALDNVSVFQPHFATGPEPKIFWRRSFHEIVALDVKLATERNLACSGIWIFGVVDCIEFFDFSLGIIRQHDLDRAQYGEPACGGAVEFVTYGVLEHSHVS